MDTVRRGRPPLSDDPQASPQSRRVTVVFAESAYARLCRHARETGRGIGSVVRDAVDAAWSEPARKTEVDVLTFSDDMLGKFEDAYRGEIRKAAGKRGLDLGDYEQHSQAAGFVLAEFISIDSVMGGRRREVVEKLCRFAGLSHFHGFPSPSIRTVAEFFARHDESQLRRRRLVDECGVLNKDGVRELKEFFDEKETGLDERLFVICDFIQQGQEG